MSKLLAVATLVAWTAFAALPADAQQMYRWVDKNGKVHYTDSPPQTPATNVEQRRMASGASDGPGYDYGTQQAVKNFPVVLYTAPNCAQPCKDARDLLVKRGVPFSEVQVTDDGSRERLKKVSNDMQVPVMTVGRDVSRGFEAGMWTTALDAAGYPKSVIGKRPAPPTAPAAAPQAAPDAKPGVDAAPAQPGDGPARPKGKYLP
jgi:glutaredoxin